MKTTRSILRSFNLDDSVAEKTHMSCHHGTSLAYVNYCENCLGILAHDRLFRWRDRNEVRPLWKKGN